VRIKPSDDQAALLLVDAGATHARVLVCNPQGKIFGHGRGGPANAFAVGEKTALANLVRAMREGLARAGVSRKSVAAAAIGSASVDEAGRGSAPIEATLRRCLAQARVCVTGDALIALQGALLGGPGVVIASGTGSIVLGKGVRGELARAGGWGPVLGDEGSAQWVGRQALQAAARATDRTGPATSLTWAFKIYFQIRSFERIIDVVYKHPMGPADLGALAPLVTKAAQRGDAVAIEIFRRAGDVLAIQAAQVAHRLGLKRAKVSYQGSMFCAGPLLLDPLRRSLRRHAPDAVLVTPALPPIGGAFLLALATLGIKPAVPVIAAFQKNCHV
jgi:N-acetylglucosamine kinase-like BadF-type ATPase